MSKTSLTLSLVIIAWNIIERQRVHNEYAERSEWYDTYDYIVIGGGTAGSVVAARLSEHTNINVLLLEAGGPQTIMTDMPGMWWSLIGSEVDWKYYTTRQDRACRSFRNNQCPYPRGKVLGGSSSINWLVYNRGNRRDYDNWVETYGAYGWSYDDVLPYFLKSENNTDPAIVALNPKYHSVDGPLAVSSIPDPNPILFEFIDSANKAGFPTIDYNTETQFGVALEQHTIDDNRVRSTTANAYLEPNKHRQNLHVLTKAMVTRILFEDELNPKRATGVKFYRDDRYHTVKARKEIIVSAGALNSAQLLLLSGIGPKNHLEEHHIPLIADIPVGEYVVDHVALGLYYDVLNQSLVKYIELNDENLYDYYVNKRGPLSKIESTVIYIRTKYLDNNEWPDGFVQSQFYPIPKTVENLVADIETYRNEWEEYYRPYLGRTSFFHLFQVNRPESRGKLRLASKDPFEPPLVDPQFLADARDLEVLVDTVSQFLELSSAPELSELVALYNGTIPGCDRCADNMLCESYLRCVVESKTQTIFHPVSTCPMGSSEWQYSVVDERLRVRKVSGLRVIDASVMPQVISGNTNAPTIMIAERGADFIKQDNNDALLCNTNNNDQPFCYQQ